MGCDIYFFVQKNIGNNDWRIVKEKDLKVIEDVSLKFSQECDLRWDCIGRDYELFNSLNNVRNRGGAFENLKRFKKTEVKNFGIGMFGGDYLHSKACVYLNDFINFPWDDLVFSPDETDEHALFVCRSDNSSPDNLTYRILFDYFIELVVDRMKRIDDNYDNVRAVFGFDN